MRKKLTWTRTHASKSKIYNFIGVVSRKGTYFVSASFLTTCCFGETEWDGETDGWKFGDYIDTSTYLERLRETMRNVGKAGLPESNLQSLEYEA